MTWTTPRTRGGGRVAPSTAPLVIRTGKGKQGSRVLSVRAHVTLRDVTFDVTSPKKGKQVGTVSGKHTGDHPRTGSKYSEGHTPNTEGVEVSFDPNTGHLFATESNYGIRAAEEITIIGNKGYVRGKVTYWTKADAQRAGIQTDTVKIRGKVARPVNREIWPEGGRQHEGLQSISSAKTETGRPAGEPPTAFKNLYDIGRANKKVTKTHKDGTTEEVAEARAIKQGDTHLQLGSGANEAAANWLGGGKRKITVLSYDPYNRSLAQNNETIRLIHKNKTDHASIFNVMNVIKEADARLLLLRQAADGVKPGGKVFIAGEYRVSGAKVGVGQQTKNGWQENRTLQSYADEVENSGLFADVTVDKKRGIITATVPKETKADKAVRESAQGGEEFVGTKFLHQGEEAGEIAGTTAWVAEAGQAFIRGVTSPDMSTALHELAHAWRLIQANLEIPEASRVAQGGLRDAEIETLSKALGVEDGKWTKEAEELLARYYEKYVLEGVIERQPGISDRSFGILQVSMARLSKRMRQIYDGYDTVLPADDIPPALREFFDRSTQRNNVEDVIESLGDEARAYYETLTIGAARGSKPTEVEQRLKDYMDRLDDAYPGWREDRSLLPTGKKGELTRRKRAVDRQRGMAEEAATAAASRMERSRIVEEELEGLHKAFDEKHPEGWTDETLSPDDLARLRHFQNQRQALERDIGFASEHLEPETRGGRDVPHSGIDEAKRRTDLPINVSKVSSPRPGAGTFGSVEIHSADDARNIFEGHVAEEIDWLRSAKQRDLLRIQEEEAAGYTNMHAASRKGSAKMLKLFRKHGEEGIQYLARSRAIRRFANDIFESASDAAARIEGAAARGEVDDKAKAEFLHYTGMFEPLTEVLNSISHKAGLLLADMKKDPWGSVQELRNEEAIHAILTETNKRLNAFHGGAETVDTYIERMMVAMKEGELNLLNQVVTRGGDRLDTVLEVFYNSILSGPRTHMVNTLSNTIYGTMLHFERKFGRGVLRRLAGDDQYPKAMAATMGLRQILMDSFRVARIALAEGSGQLDPAGSRAAFDTNRGVFAGKQTLSYAERMTGKRAEDLPGPFGHAINAVMQTISVGGWPTRFLGAEDELFKQLHNRLIVIDELGMQAVKKFPDDPTAQATFVREEFDIIVGDGNLFTKRRIKFEGLREAAAKGITSKMERTKYAEQYFNKTWTPERGAIAERALGFARKSTFTNPNGYRRDIEGNVVEALGANPISQGIQKLGMVLQEAGSQVRWIRFLAPFINTPTNLLSEASDHLLSPVFDGIIPGAKKLRQIVRKETDTITSELDPRAKEEALGRLALSSTIISLVWMKTMSGEITGSGPRDPEAQRLLRGAGWQPYSVRFGDSYFGYGRLDPLASVVGIVADIAEGMNGNPYMDDPEEEGIKALMMGSMMAVFRNLSEKSYLSGMINFASALDNPDYYGRAFANNLSGALVPNISAQIAGQLDSTSREMRSIVDTWKSRIPGLGSDIMPKRNFIGEEEKRVQYAGGPLLGLLMPIPYSEVSSDPIRREVTKFGEVVGPPDATKYGTLDLREYHNNRGQTAYDRYQELQGSVKLRGRTVRDELEKLIDSRSYQRMPDFAADGSTSPKMGEIRKTVRNFRKAAWDELLREFPLLEQNHAITLSNRTARRKGRAEKDLLSLIR